MDPLNDMTYTEYESYLQSGPMDEMDWDESIPTLNHVYLVGRIGSKPEARYFGPNNTIVVTTSLALPRYYAYVEREDQNIEYGKEETDWYKLEIWNNVAEFVMKFVDKGTRVGIMGSLDTDFFPTKNDNKLGKILKIRVQDLDILESKTESEARKVTKRGPSFFTGDDEDGDDDDNDTYNPSSQRMSGGFFDPS
jgi:single-strand DNA-binding protein